MDTKLIAAEEEAAAPASKERVSGILLHPTSLPSPYGIGDLGDGAYEFVDFLKRPASISGRRCLLAPPVSGIPPTRVFPPLPDSLC